MNLRNNIRRWVNSGALGWHFPAGWAIKTCVYWSMYGHERSTVEYLKNTVRPGDTICDIGAHIGYYVRLLSRLTGASGKIIAFEPHPKNIKLLQLNCRKCANMEIVPKAVAATTGKSRFYEHATSSASHALSDISQSGRYIEVDLTSMDDWYLNSKNTKLNIVLIDVEGYEDEVLMGMQNVIKKHSELRIILEYCPDNYRQANRDISLIHKAFKQCGLRVTTMLGRMGRKEMPLGEILDKQFATINNLLPQWGYEGGYVNIVAMREGEGATQSKQGSL